MRRKDYDPFVEVAKALSVQSKILIMDEPTAALMDREIDPVEDFHISVFDAKVADRKQHGFSPPSRGRPL